MTLSCLSPTSRILTVDIECLTKNKGNPFTESNKIVSIHIKDGDKPTQCFFQDTFTRAVYLLEKGDLWITFNGKFDINWIRRTLGITPPSVWDVQLAEFLFSSQLNAYPSLNDAAMAYGFPLKIDKVKELWEQGIDTDQIDRHILAEYGNYDVDLTYEIFKRQVARFEEENAKQYKLFRLHCNDLLVLADMEWNGIVYDCEASIEYAKKLQDQIKQIEEKVNGYTDGIPINLNSNEHKSALLYGGKISRTIKLPIGVFKTGARAGEPKFKNQEQIHTLPRLVEPLKGSECQKEGIFSVDEPTLLSLKPNKTTKWIIKQILDRARLAKLCSTYLEGLPKLIEKMEWPTNKIHSTLNQSVVVTGRLSSVKPNVQNQPKEVKQFCISRYN